MRRTLELVAIATFALAAFAEADPLGSKSIVTGEIGKKIDEFLGRLVPFGYAGAVVVAKDGQVVLYKGYGMADREAGRSVTPETVFTIGSITKQFTGAAILKLEMEGKLKVTDRINQHFDGVPPDKKEMTLHHLLTHSSGLPNGFGGDHDLSATRQQTLERAMKAPLQWSPGKRYDYSNLGYSLLAMIVEKVSGMGYEQYLREHLFLPAGMVQTGYLLPKFGTSEYAVGYRENERWGTVLERPLLDDGPCWNLRGNGGIHSTVGDMYRWHLALNGEDVLSSQAKAKYFAPHMDEGGGGSFYGYGWVNMRTRRGTRLLTHNGGNMVFSADFRRYVDEGIAFYHCSNSSEFFVDPISRQISRIIFGEKYLLPPKTVVLDASSMSRFAGKYVSQTGDVLEMRVMGRNLAVVPSSQTGLAMVAPTLRGHPQRYKQLNQRTLAMIKASAAGDHSKLAKLFEGRLSFDEVASAANKDWVEARKKFGTLKAIAVVGSLPGREGMTTTILRRDFADGSDYVRCVSRRGRLAGYRPVNHPPTFLVAPVNNHAFVGFDLASRQSKRLEFQASPDGAVVEVRTSSGATKTAFKRVS